MIGKWPKSQGLTGYCPKPGQSAQKMARNGAEAAGGYTTLTVLLLSPSMLASMTSPFETAPTPDGRSRRAGTQASHNILLLSFFDQVNELKRAVAWAMVVRTTHRPPSGYASFVEHRKIVAAIEARDPAAAREAMREHIGLVSARLFGDV